MYILKIPRCDPSTDNFAEFRRRFAAATVIDPYEDMLSELFLIRNPPFRFVPDHKVETRKFVDEHLSGRPPAECGVWFYFEWTNVLFHCLPEPLYLELRTARNKNLIVGQEQEKFYKANVGIAGLSVGSHCALTIAMMGGARCIKVADPDCISGSNLNRVRYGVTTIGVNKATLAARQILEINPYSEVHVYPDGVTPENTKEFLGELDVLVEEVDNLGMKIHLRIEARKLGLPVVMATDNGDGIIVDVERYDLDKDLPIFCGAVGDLTVEQLAKLPPTEIPKLATKIAGPDYVVPRMQSSLLEVGRTLYSWPQLGSAATFSGVAIAYLVRAIRTGRSIRSGKYNLSLDEVFDADYRTEAAREERQQQRSNFLEAIGLKSSAAGC